MGDDIRNKRFVMTDAPVTIAGANAFLMLLRVEMPDLSLRSLEILFAIAEQPGQNMSQISWRCGLGRATGSRLIAQLGAQTMRGDPGLGLVMTLDDPEDSRIKIVRLTDHGEATVARLLATLTPSAPDQKGPDASAHAATARTSP